jgi:hypothetical protein
MDIHLPPHQLRIKKLTGTIVFLLWSSVSSCQHVSSREFPFNLNEYIEIVPPTYFIKVFFGSVLSENIGPSNVPITLVSHNTTETVHERAEYWCRFLPTQSFIGARTERTFNLIFSTNIDTCYEYSTSDPGMPSKSDTLRFALSGFNIKTSTGRNCKVNTDNMYTLILAEIIRKDVILRDINGFWFTFELKLFPYSTFIFRSINPNVREICSFAFPGKLISFNCFSFRNITFANLTQMPVGPKSWMPSRDIVHWWNNPSGTLSKWNRYFEERVEMILYFEILAKANETGSFNYWSNAVIGQLFEWQVLSNTYYVQVDYFKTGFISCYSEPKIEFEMYVRSFKLEVWILLLVCCTFIATIMHWYIRKYELTVNFTPALFLLSSLVEEVYPIPKVLWNTNIFKIFALTWVLPAMIFTNLYTGLMISDVTSPLRGEILKSFEQILDPKWDNYTPTENKPRDVAVFWAVNYSLSSGINEPLHTMRQYGCNPLFNSKSYDLYHAQFRDKKSFALLQKPIDSCAGDPLSIDMQQRYLSHPWLYSLFDDWSLELSTYGIEGIWNIKRIARLLAFFSPRNRHYPRDPMFSTVGNQEILQFASAAIEKELVACEQSVFLGKTYDLKFELSYLKSNYPRKKFYESEGSFETTGSDPVIWTFTDGGKSLVPNYFKRLVESGLPKGIISLRKQKSYLKRRVGTKLVQDLMSNETDAGIYGSIQTVFYLTFAFLFVANMVFLLEFIFAKQKQEHFIFKQKYNEYFTKQG